MNRSDQGLRFHGDTVAGPGQLDFAVNLAPGGPPGWLQEALRDGLSRAAAYPDQGPATTAVAARHRRPPEEVVLLNGSAEAFWLLAQVLQPNLAVVVHPRSPNPRPLSRRPVTGCDVSGATRTTSTWTPTWCRPKPTWS